MAVPASPNSARPAPARNLPRARLPVVRAGPVQLWFVPALLLTVALHAALFGLLHLTRLEAFTPTFYDRYVPRAFNVRQVEIDPKLLDSPGTQRLSKVPTTPDPKPTDLQVPGAKPSFEQELAQANVVLAAPKIAEQSMTTADKPRVDSGEDLAKALDQSSGTAAALPSDLSGLREQFANAKPHVGRGHPSFPVEGPDDLSRPNAGPNPGRANFSNLDGLLSKRGPLSGREGPILLPTDLLFDYDSAELRTDAAGSLEKLGQLIRQNPQATFTIEGHTDLFGGPDYNQVLSERRAASVKEWLVLYAGIDPGRISTRGFGSRRPLVPGGSVESQQLNRRVEIVIHTRGPAGR